MTATETATSPYETCMALFDGYPLAVETARRGVRCMTLMVPGTPPEFCVLASYPKGFCQLHYWHREGTDITPGAAVPAWAAAVLAGGVPVPRAGSLFGYAVGEQITAVIPVYGYSEDHPEPSFSPMPRAGISRDLWPPFTGEPAIGRWFWDMVRDGRLVNLAPVVAGTSGAVFRVPLESPVPAGCVAVTRDVTTPSGEVLGEGLYVYHADLDAGVPLPGGLEGATDLAPRFAGE